MSEERSWGLDTIVEKKLKGLEDIGHQEAGNALFRNIDQGTKRSDEVILCVKQHRSSDINGTAVWKKFPGCNLIHRIRNSS
jgi:hypothetical protein